MRDNETCRIVYSFVFEDGNRKTYEIAMDGKTMHMLTPRSSPPEWTSLRHQRCAPCRLDPEKDGYCPIALNMATVIDGFKDCSSFEDVYVTVTTEQRVYSKKTSLQHGLSSLTGVIMATSGCPVLEYLKPMARFHLPFASIEETEFRMVSMYLVAQLKREARGLAPDWKLEGLKEIYESVAEVNRGFAKRIAEVAKNDANMNALVNLDCFAKTVPYAARSVLKDLDSIFDAYLK